MDTCYKKAGLGDKRRFLGLARPRGPTRRINRISLSPDAEVRACIHKRGMLDGREISPPDKEISRRNPDGFQEKLTRYGSKRPSRTAFKPADGLEMVKIIAVRDRDDKDEDSPPRY